MTSTAHNIYHIDFSSTQHLPYWLFWHTTLTILTFLAYNTHHIDLFLAHNTYHINFSGIQDLSYWPFLAQNTYHIDLSGIQHLSYWLFWHTFIILIFLAHNTCYIAFSGTKHLSYWSFRHSTFIILTFLAYNTYHIDIFWHTTLTITQCTSFCPCIVCCLSSWTTGTGSLTWWTLVLTNRTGCTFGCVAAVVTPWCTGNWNAQIIY